MKFTQEVEFPGRMWFLGILWTSLMVHLAIADVPESPRIVIVGAGASGIAAAAKLFENGFRNVTILEAENRIGGRVYTAPFDEYLVDVGAQWVHGQKGNVVYDMALPLGLVENSTMENYYYDMYDTSGALIDANVTQGILDFFLVSLPKMAMDKGVEGNLGNYMDNEFKDYFEKHPEINESLRGPIKQQIMLTILTMVPADSWHNVMMETKYEECEGDRLTNWKTKGYSTALDILMKKIPNPEEELPVINNTILNSVVNKIDYANEDGVVRITTTDGKEYHADHVIVTVSLGVMKENYESLFVPPLPDTTVNSIKGMSFGAVGKVYLLFEEPWWNGMESRSGFAFLWNENDKKEIENDPSKKWLLSLCSIFRVIYRPRVLEVWFSGEGAREIESLSDEQVVADLTALLRKVLSNRFNVTSPTQMLRSKWYSNPHFRGTYSYYSPQSMELNASPEALAVPILKNEKPVILFAGECTNVKHYSTVHGAIETGWREAERLTNLYSKSSSSSEAPQT